MTDPVTPQNPTAQEISRALEQLRALCQISIQEHWRCHFGDLPTTEALQPDRWHTWAPVTLNHKQHVAWAKGRNPVWLGQTIVIPSDLQGYPLEGLVLRLALSWWAESAAIFINGQLVQEGDLFDCFTRIPLTFNAQPGEAFSVAVRLVSPGHDPGALVRSRCDYETDSAGDRVEPSFVADELAVLSQYLQTFAPEKLPEVAGAIAGIPWSLVGDRPAFDQALAQLRQQLHPLGDWLKQRRIQLLGHAHLDMAWLWDVAETWQAADRTFRSVLKLQQEFPELIFCHSTPALYEWMEQNRPELFEQIRTQVAAGRWEVVGGMWIEPELNLIGGESLVRQVLYAQEYCQEKFGAVNRVAWLPDSFGFCWQLPQILKQGGVDYFVTQKLRWNDTTQFPHEVFWWQAPDGTAIFSLMLPPIGENIQPMKLATYASQWEAKTGIPATLWLPGVGDHGGGPTRDMLETARRWHQSPLFPQLEFTTALAYLQSLESLSPTPTWDSDLYLEFHRGCYTTHADQKLANRRCEELLYQAELFSSLATLTTGAPYPAIELEAAWKKVLFNQFHDILPGSAIPQVFVDANEAWQDAKQVGTEILRNALETIAHAIALPDPPHPEAQAIGVFNSLNWHRTEIVSLSLPGTNWHILDLTGERVPAQADGESVSFLAEIPAIGYQLFWLCPSRESLPVPTATEAYVLENGFLKATIDPETGDLASLFDKTLQMEILSGPGNQLQAFEDNGQYWDAWNIDPNYASHPLPPAKLLEIYPAVQGVLETRLKVVRQIGHSVFEQTYLLPTHSPVLQIATQVNWQERHILVKAAFPLKLDADAATCEIPCGAIQRPTRPQTEQEKAQWEVPALRWADLSNDTWGVSLLNDCKYGYDSQPGQLRLTLLRGSEWPNPDADRGHHLFTYALYPHRGSWQAAQTVRRGYEINQSPLVVSFAQHSSQKTLPASASLLELGDENLVLMALKRSQRQEDTWILRCYECHGQPATLQLKGELGVAIDRGVNLLEQPQLEATIQRKPSPIRPWQIANFQLHLISETWDRQAD